MGVRTTPRKGVSGFRGANHTQPAPASVNFASKGEVRPSGRNITANYTVSLGTGGAGVLLPGTGKKIGPGAPITRPQLRGSATETLPKPGAGFWGRENNPPRRVSQDSRSVSGPAPRSPPLRDGAGKQLLLLRNLTGFTSLSAQERISFHPTSGFENQRGFFHPDSRRRREEVPTLGVPAPPSPVPYAAGMSPAPKRVGVTGKASAITCEI